MVEGEILALVEPVSYKLIAPVSGTLLSCLVRNNTKIEAKQVVCIISTCTHPILTITDVCTTCHVNLHETSEYAFYITPSNHPIKRRVADVEAESLAKKRALLASNRLVLVLDLDQTVLHAALLNGYEGKLACELTPPEEEVFAFELSGRSRMIVKFRPGLRDFLLNAHRLYEIHVYTMANAEYAAKIVELINTKILADVEPLLRQQIIGTRIITRSHTEDSYEMQLKQQGGAAYVMKLREKRKDIKHIVGDSSIAVILDDSDGVWPDYLDHLIQIYPFVYWPNQEDLNKTFHARLSGAPTAPSASLLPPSPLESPTMKLDSTPTPLPAPVAKKRPSPVQLDDPTQSDSEEALEDGVKRRKSAENSEEDQAAEHKLSTDSTENSTSAAPLSETEQMLLRGSSIDSNAMAESSSTMDQKKDESSDSGSKPLSASFSNSSGISVPETLSSTLLSSSAPQVESVHTRVSSPAIDSRIMPLLLPFGIRYLPSSNQDTLLDSMLTVLTRLHRHFFELPEKSKRRQVQLILPRMRRQVLEGRKICLSGVIPHQPKMNTEETANPSSAASKTAQVQKMLWPEQSKAGMREIARLEHYGGTYEENISAGNPEGVTHVVSARGSTMKVRNASQSKGVFCVTKQWLDQSIIHWKVQPETNFQIPDIPLCMGPAPVFPAAEDTSIWTEKDQGLDAIPPEEEMAADNLHLGNGFQEPMPSSPHSDSSIDLESLLQADYDISEEAEEDDM